MDLNTKYLGMQLRTPLVASASPISQEISGIRGLEDAGASAVVLYSLFEEQLHQEGLELEHHLSAGTESFAESLTYFPQSSEFRTGPEGYLNHIRKTKDAVDIPIIASLNGATLGGWAKYAKQLEQAGADAIECNIYFIPTSMDISASEVEKIYIDLDELEIKPNVLLSSPQELRLPLTWIGILYGRIRASLAATSGVHGPEDVIKLLLVGADVTMLCSTLLRNGISHLRHIEHGVREWMEDHEYESVHQMQGSMSQIRCPDPGAFERAQYMRAVKGLQHVVVTGREAWRVLSGE